MFRSIAIASLLLLGPDWFSAESLAQNVPQIDGVTDQTTYTDSVSFQIPAAPGFIYSALLDGKRVPVDVTNSVSTVDYHELLVVRTNTSTTQIDQRLVRFIIQSSQRLNPEKGLIVWTPYPLIPSTAAEFAGATLELVMPANYPLDLDIPVIGWTADAIGNPRRGNGTVTAPGFEASSFLLRRGIGFALLSPAQKPGTLIYDAHLTSLATRKEVQIEPNTAWRDISGILSSSAEWTNDSRIHLTDGFTIPAGSTLTVGAGTIVKIEPLVNVTNSGRLIVNGSLDNPVVFTSTNRVAPERNSGAWGGFILRGAEAQLTANGAIITGGGGGKSFNFSPGSSHRSEQAVLLAQSGAQIALTNCYLINQAGQIANAYNSDITYDHCLLQRAITAGESVGGTITINHSSVIEFPADDGIVDSQIADADFDAVYFTTGTHIVNDSLIGFSKDDAIDSGSGGAGTVLVTNCWIESALHEGLAWSGGNRVTETYDTVVINCGQGIEAGWSTGLNSPICFAERLLTTANSIGARFGDNYDWSYQGFLQITNSLDLFNYRDVFAKTWNTTGSAWDTNHWVDRLQQMDLRGNYFTAFQPDFPANSVWDPGQDGWRLAHWMSTPPGAPVGIGLAVRTNDFPMSAILDGIPVRLSSFTTNFVSVNYSFQSPGQPTIPGTIVFVPGETIKRISPAGLNLQNTTELSVVLTGANKGELTGQTKATFHGNLPTPNISVALPAIQVDQARVAEGIPVRLDQPNTAPVGIDYTIEATGRNLVSGRLQFSPGQTLAWTQPIPLPANDGLVRLTVTNPRGAIAGGPSQFYFINLPAGIGPTTQSLINKGSVWKYLDTGVDPGADWKNAADTNWPSGPAQLGFGDGDEATVIRSARADGSRIIAYYLRQSFSVDNPAAVQDLSLWLLRDDGAVVYLNGNEIFRSPNMPAKPAIISADTLATSTGENTIDTATIPAATLRAGENVLAVEIHQQSTTSSDTSFDLQLTANVTATTPASRILSVGLFDKQVTLVWPENGFTLDEADEIGGPWKSVATSSPAQVSPLTRQKFFRLHK